MAAAHPGPQISQSVSEHPTPNSSKEHRFWRSEFRTRNQDDETLRNILWLVNASDSLQGIGKIAVNTMAILESVLENPAIEDSVLLIFQGWHRALELIAGRNAQRETVNPNGGDCYVRNPLWALLWEDIQNPSVLKKYRILQGHLLLAHAKYLSRESVLDSELNRDAYESYGHGSIWPAFPDSPYEAARRIRNLTHGKWAGTLGQIEADLSPHDFIKSLRHMKADPDDLASTWQQYQRVISAFVAKAHGLEPWSNRVLERHQPKSGQRKTVYSSDVDPGDPDDEYARWPSGQLVSVGKVLTDEALQEYAAADLDPDELRDSEDHFAAAAVDPAAFQQLAIDSALAARGQLRHVQMDHQALAWRYKEAAVSELAHLMSETYRLWAKLPSADQWGTEERETAETITVVQVILWTGRTLKEALELVALRCAASAEAYPAGSFLYIFETSEWQVDVQPPPYRSETQAPDNHVHPHVRGLKLQDLADTGSFIEALVCAQDLRPSGSCAHDCTAVGVRVFAGAPARLELMVREFLKQSDSTGRLSIRRVGSALLNQIVTRTGDQMSGALITGRFGPLTRTERFYACYPLRSLGEKYSQICRLMVEQLTGRSDVEVRPVPDGEGFAGARLCARYDAVKSAIETIRRDIDEARGKKGSAEHRHNLLTLYTVMWFCMATSCRAIRTPYLKVDCIDLETGFACLCDKDDDAHHKTRLIWVPLELIAQMERYKRHCKFLARKNPLLGECAEPCFFIEDGRPVEVRPKTLSKYMRPYLQVPPNFHRKFIRAQLVEAGGGELVSYWLGHAFQGEEIWNPHSTLSPAEYREGLRALLPALLKRLGWELR